MTLGLLTLHLLSIAAIGITVFYGIHIPEGGGAFGRHFLYALGAAYARSGNRARGVELLKQAREKAAARNQTQLMAGIDRDLATLQR